MNQIVALPVDIQAIQILPLPQGLRKLNSRFIQSARSIQIERICYFWLYWLIHEKSFYQHQGLLLLVLHKDPPNTARSYLAKWNNWKNKQNQ